MPRSTPRPAVALAFVAVALAVVAARWEANTTADEHASERLTAIGARADLGEKTTTIPAPGSMSIPSPPPTRASDPADLRTGPTASVNTEVAAVLGAIGRADGTSPISPPPPPPPRSDANPTPSTSLSPPPPPASVEARGQRALATIGYPWQSRLPDWEIRFHPGIEGAYGYTLTDELVIDVYVRDGQSDQLLAHVIAHEIGHAVDVTYNDDADRDRWQTTRGFSAQWWPDSRASDFATGAGDFAESFAAWQVGTASFRSQLGEPPTARHVAVLAELAAG